MLVDQAPASSICHIIDLCPDAVRCRNHDQHGASDALKIALSIKASDVVVNYILTTLGHDHHHHHEMPEGTHEQLSLHIALRHGYSDVMIESILHANPEAKLHQDRDGQLPLHIALENQRSSDLIQQLFQPRDGLGLMPDRVGFLPLHVAVAHHQWKVAEVLARVYPDAIGQRDPLADLPLHVAVAEGEWTCASVLLRGHPASASIPDRCHRLPLVVALASLTPGTSSSESPTMAFIHQCLEAYPESLALNSTDDSSPVQLCIQRQQWKLMEHWLDTFPEILLTTLLCTTNHEDIERLPILCVLARSGAPASLWSGLQLRWNTHQHLPVSLSTHVRREFNFEIYDSPLILSLEHRHWSTAQALGVLFPELAQVKSVTARFFPIQVGALAGAPARVLSSLSRAFPQVAMQLNVEGESLVVAAIRARNWVLVRALVEHAPECAAVPSPLKAEFPIVTAMEKCAPGHVILSLFEAYVGAMWYEDSSSSNVGEMWILERILAQYAHCLNHHVPVVMDQVNQDNLFSPPPATTTTTCLLVDRIARVKEAQRFIDTRGNSMLHLAVMYHHVPFITALLDLGQNIFQCNHKGESPQDLSSNRNPHLLDLKTLMRRPRWIQARDHNGQTVLFHAVQAKKYNLLPDLMSAGADPLVVDDFGQRISDVVPVTDRDQILPALGYTRWIANRYLISTDVSLDLQTGKHVQLIQFHDLATYREIRQRWESIARRWPAHFTTVIDGLEDLRTLVIEGGTGRSIDQAIIQDPSPPPLVSTTEIVRNCCSGIYALAKEQQLVYKQLVR